MASNYLIPRINAIRFSDPVRLSIYVNRDPKEVVVSQHAAVLFRSSHRRPIIWSTQRLGLMWEAWRTRRILATLDAYQLKDIGVSRSDAEAEAARAPWDIEPRR
jgi:uncharacterized protein YjiS (DUF1127 family)